MITVYWSCNHYDSPSALRAEEPVQLQNHFFEKYPAEQADGYKRCPSVRNFFNNLYGLKSYYDYRIDFNLNEGKINSSDYTKEFLQRLLVRNMESALFSWPTDYIFFTDTKSLEMEVYPAFMESNDFVNKANLIPGVFDIGKWYRPLDCAFHLKEKNCSLQFSIEDILMNLRFRTKEKIEFRYFTISKELSDFTKELMIVKDHKYASKTTSVLSYYYDLFAKKNFKKKILEFINKEL